MPESKNKQKGPITLLTGIGLVLIGLLAGILFMLFVMQRQDAMQMRSQVVDRVELGGKPAEVPVYREPVYKDSAAMHADVATLSQSFKQVARTVTPAVVYIRVEMAGSASDRGWFHQFGQQRQSVGSGVIISETGYIVTNNHVVEGGEEILVTLHDKRQYRAKVVGTDPSTDLAVLKAVSNDPLPAAPLGNSDQVSVGEWVIAVGNPFRLTSTVTAGIVSALGRQVNIIEGRFGIEDFIQTDAAINPGNSGGALVNLQGELIGINTAIATESGSYEGYGFAVPVNLMARVVEDLIAHGEVKRGYLGVSIVAIDAAQARRIGLDRVAGVYLDDIHPGSAAEIAGLETGDVVLSINGRQVNEPNELQRAVAIYRPGDNLNLEVWRDGDLRTFSVKLLGEDDAAFQSWVAAMEQQDEENLREYLQEEPESWQAESAFEIEGWGLGLKQLNESMRTTFAVESGVFLAYVKKGSPAAEARLPRGVIILDINDETVYSLEGALMKLEKHQNVQNTEETVLFRVKHRDGRIAFYEVETDKIKEESSE